MNQFAHLWVISLMTCATAMTQSSELPEINPKDYPESKRGSQVDEFFGHKVADPYRWLEDLNSDATKSWIKKQAQFTAEFLQKLPGREKMEKRIRQMWDYDKFGIPRKVEGKLIYSRLSGLQNQAILYWKEDQPDAEEKILIDPNLFSEDGTVALTGTSVSNDGKWIAYGISRAGSDWQEWKIREIETGHDLDDHLQWIKFSSCQWAPDDKSLVYSRYAEPEKGEELKGENYYQKVYRHYVGTAQSEDDLIYSRDDQKTWGFGTYYTDEGRYLCFDVWEGAASDDGFFYRDLQKGEDSPVMELINDFSAKYQFVGNEGERFYFWTNYKAVNGRLVEIDLRRPEPNFWKTIIAEDADRNLRSVHYIGKKFIAEYMTDAHEEAWIFDQAGKNVSKVSLPGFVSVGGFRGKQTDTETYYSVSGFTIPGAIYHYDVTTGESSLHAEPKLEFDPSLYQTEQVFYKSKDGTKIPMFLTYKKGLVRDQSNPVILYGYGGFNISLGPRFSSSRIAWMEKGGIFAQANLRGGGEYGREWHNAGKGLKKQNVFDDFIAAAEYLVKEKYTTTEKLGISGGSNGGLLVGACVNQRPGLFAAAIPSVGVHDMLRFPKFTIGWAWQNEYGYPEEKEEDFLNLLKFSPLHNITEGTSFPPILVTTADHDDRVFPAHSFKYAAALQHAQASTQPTLIRIETDAGHGAGIPTSKVIERIADEYAFFAAAFGMGWED